MSRDRHPPLTPPSRSTISPHLSIIHLKQKRPRFRYRKSHEQNMRGNTQTVKVHFQGHEEDFIVFVSDAQSVRDWRNDRSIPLAQVLNGWQVFITHKSVSPFISFAFHLPPSSSLYVSVCGHPFLSISGVETPPLLISSSQENSGQRTMWNIC